MKFPQCDLRCVAVSGLSVTVKHIIHFSVYIFRYIFRYTFRCTGYWYIDHYLFVNRIGSLLRSLFVPGGHEEGGGDGFVAEHTVHGKGPP